MRIGKFLIGCNVAAVLAATMSGARADVAISKQATANMSCVSGVCSPTAAKAVLNATDLATMLASGDVKVTTGSGATNIVVKDSFSWTSTSRLTLDAMQSVEFDKPVTVAGPGAVTITTNDGGTGGEFAVLPEQGSIQFWDLASSLIIGGQPYTLVGDIKTLAADIANNPSGFYALAKPYDASVDGTYTSSPIPTGLAGTVDGLGNTIAHLSVTADAVNLYGLFLAVVTSGAVMHLGVVDADFGIGHYSAVGLLAGNNVGTINGCWSSGSIDFSAGNSAGGLVGENGGLIEKSFAHVKLRSLSEIIQSVGGLTGFLNGNIDSSYASGSISSGRNGKLKIGGLVGRNLGAVANSFARNNLAEKRHSDTTYFGGLIGQNDDGAAISAAYAAGKVTAPRDDISGGGLVGFDGAEPGSIQHSYWDTDLGVHDTTQGAGNIVNDPGITGLTTTQFKASLPKGFDPRIWAEKKEINDGFPYLISIPVE